MSNIEKIEDFYRNKYNWIPENLNKNIGHFNVFQLDTNYANGNSTLPYSRRDFYKISLIIGGSHIEYADKVIDVTGSTLVFSNPFIPYKWIHNNNVERGCYCIFTHEFFHNYGNLQEYEVFQPTGLHAFNLDEEQVKEVEALYAKMFEEIKSDYKHKYDALRMYVFELLHMVSKIKPLTKNENSDINGNKRISLMFTELLERQFPLDPDHRKIKLRRASEFAEHLNIHVNHLNRALKATTSKTTTQIIAERLLQEAKILLKHSSWSVSEIAYSLGFNELTHFNNFFRKHADLSPLQFRNV